MFRIRMAAGWSDELVDASRSRASAAAHGVEADNPRTDASLAFGQVVADEMPLAALSLYHPPVCELQPRDFGHGRRAPYGRCKGDLVDVVGERLAALAFRHGSSSS